MHTTRFNPRFLTLCGLILLSALARLLATADHSPLVHLTPIGATALFGGAYFSNRSKAYLLPLLTLWGSDLLLNRFLYFGKWMLVYEGFYWVYGAFALMVLTGRLLLKTITIRNVVLAGVVAALLHWLITDLGVWLEGSLYPRTWEGLLACYVAALPYLKNMLLGNWVFSALLFGTFEMAARKFPVLADSRV